MNQSNLLLIISGIGIFTNLILLISLFIIQNKYRKSSELIEEKFDSVVKSVRNSQRELRSETSVANAQNIESLKQTITEGQSTMIEDSLKNIIQGNQEIIDGLQQIVTSAMSQINRSVIEKTDHMFQNDMQESLSQVTKQLQTVQNEMSNMPHLSASIADLKMALNTVQSSGALVEMQVERVFREILSSDHYVKDIILDDESNLTAEFAIKLPAANDSIIYLPIVASYDTSLFMIYLEACKEDDKAKMQAAEDSLFEDIRKDVQSIADKYLPLSATTDFVIMYLPYEGLYSTITSNSSFYEEMLCKYHVNIAGPSNLSAIVSSLQYGFKIFEDYKQQQNVKETLEAVRIETSRFAEVLTQVRKQIKQMDSTMEDLVYAPFLQIQNQVTYTARDKEDGVLSDSSQSAIPIRQSDLIESIDNND